jgi:hypothetical protein
MEQVSKKEIMNVLVQNSGHGRRIKNYYLKFNSIIVQKIEHRSVTKQVCVWTSLTREDVQST